MRQSIPSRTSKTLPGHRARSTSSRRGSGASGACSTHTTTVRPTTSPPTAAGSGSWGPAGGISSTSRRSFTRTRPTTSRPGDTTPPSLDQVLRRARSSRRSCLPASNGAVRVRAVTQIRRGAFWLYRILLPVYVLGVLVAFVLAGQAVFERMNDFDAHQGAGFLTAMAGSLLLFLLALISWRDRAPVGRGFSPAERCRHSRALDPPDDARVARPPRVTCLDERQLAVLLEARDADPDEA